MSKSISFSATLIFILFHFLAYTQPQNNSCNNAQVILPGVTCAIVAATFSGATNSIAAPNCGLNASQDVWFQFVANAETNFIQLGATSGLNHGFQLFEETCDGLAIQCVNAAGANAIESGLFNNFVVGTTYFIRVFNANSTTSSANFTICVQSIPAPEINACSNAQIIVPSSICVNNPASFSGASVSFPAPTCEINSSQDIWFQFVATTETNFIQLSASSGLNHGFQIFEGSCAGSSINCVNAAGVNAIESGLFNNFIVGNTYFVRVFNVNAVLSTANFNICIQSYATPPNNSCTDAQVLVPGSTCQNTTASFSGSSINSTVPTCATNASQDVWFQFVATETVNQVILSSSIGLDHGYEIYEGSCSGTTIHCRNNVGTNSSENGTHNNFTIGTTYYIRVFNVSSGLSTASFNICLIEHSLHVYNDCQNALNVNPTSYCGNITTSFSGSNINGPIPDCAPSASQDIWIQFIASVDTYRISLNGVTNLNHGFEIFENSCGVNSIHCINNAGFGGAEVSILNDFVVGSTYLLRIFNVNNDLSISNLTVCIQAQPVNNVCDNAIEIFPVLGEFCNNNTQVTFVATDLNGSAPTCGLNASQDIWYKFTAITTMNRIELFSASGVNHGFEIFESSCSGTLMHCRNAASSGAAEVGIYANFVVGNEYFIRIFNATSSISTASFFICLRGYPIPSNNDCLNATVITPGTTCSTISTSFSGTNSSQSNPLCGADVTQDRWYQFEATSTSYFIQLNNVSQVNHGFEIYENSCSGPVINCVNNQPSGAESAILDNFVIGNTYYLRLFNLSTTFSNNSIFTFCVQSLPVPIHNECSGAIVVQPNSGWYDATLAGANLSGTGPSCAPNAGQDVWYQFTPNVPTNRIRLNGISLFDHGFIVYEGSCNGPVFQCVNNSGPGGSEDYTSFNFIPGTTYYIRAYTAQSPLSLNTLSLQINEYPEPIYNSCENALLIVPGPTCVYTTATFAGTTTNSPLPLCSPNSIQDAWVQFTATSETHHIRVNSGFNFEVYENSCNGSVLQCVSNSTFTTMNNFITGSIYFIRVFRPSGPISLTTFSVCVQTPLYDECSTAMIVEPTTACTNIPLSFEGTILNSPAPSCGSNSSQDIWVQFTATAYQYYVQTQAQSTFNHGFQVFESSCSGNPIVCVNDFVGGTLNFIESTTLLNLNPGTTYYVRIFNATTTQFNGVLNLCIQATYPPLNNFCDDALVLVPSIYDLPLTATLVGSSITFPAPPCAPNALQDVWFQFTATQSSMTINTTGGLAFQVFNGSCNGTQIACVTNSSAVLNNLVVGQTYYVRVFKTISTPNVGNFNIYINGAIPANCVPTAP